jgi:hypothetical protein
MIKILSPIDIQPLLDEYTHLEKLIQWTDYGHKGKQAGLQYQSDEDPWASAVGKSRGDELAFRNLNPFFKNTIVESLINEFKLVRSRLMWVGPFACYSMHKDTTARIHIPIITNPECYFVFKQGSVSHLSAGSVYWVDTTIHHTFMNCSDKPRLHLVGVIDK